MSITRSGNHLTRRGRTAGRGDEVALASSVLGQVMPGAIIDRPVHRHTRVSRRLDAAGLGGLFFAVVGIPDFDLKLEADTVTLSGTAPAEDVKASR